MTIKIERMYQTILDDPNVNEFYDTSILTDMPVDVFRDSLNDTSQSMLCFLDQHDLTIDVLNDFVTFDIATFHIICRKLDQLQNDYDNHNSDLSDDAVDYDISYPLMLLDLLNDFYYREYRTTD